MKKTFCLLLLLFLLSDNAFALDKVVLQLRWDHQFQFAGYYAAEMQGYFREAGLDVEIRGAITSGQQLKQAAEEVTSGRADFGIGAADVIIANERGADLKVVAGVMQRSSSRFYLLDKHGPVSLRELAENLRVARVVNGLVDVEFQAMLRSQGIDPTVVEPYRFEPGLDYFIAGDVDVIPGYSLGFPFDAEKLGLSFLSINPAQYGIDFCGDSIFSRGDLIRQHPQMVADFVSASMKGWIYALQNPQQVIAYIEKNYPRVFHREDLTKFNRFQAEQLPALMESDIVAPGYINQVNWRKMHRALNEAGLVDSSFEELDLLWSPEEALPKIRQERLLLNLYLALSVLLTMLLGLIVLYIFKERHRKGLIHSRRNYQRLFDQTLVSIWTEDITDVVHYLDDLYQCGVSDLRAYLQEHPAEVFEIGSKVKVTNLNDVTFDMFRIENRDISAISFADYIPESAIDVLIDFLVSIWERKTRFESETTYRRGDGSEFPALIAIQLPSNKDDLKNVPVSVVDITERKRVEREKAKLETQLQQAQKIESVGRLAGGVAHDFNNMLGVILGHAELGLTRLESTHKVYSDLQQIKKSAERSADLTRQLLAFARKQTVAPKMINLNEAITNMLAMLQRLIGEDILLTWQKAPEVCQINMDPSQIDQLLANLCVNARDAIIDTGRINIETRTCSVDTDYCVTNPEATPGDYVCLVVSDDGEGMDQETLPHIFEPFYTTKEQGKGTGLGLATVYGIIKQNNGFINISSRPGEGTTFSVYLPHFTGQSIPKQPEVETQKVLQGKETILLVEDEKANLHITAVMLEEQGYTVLRADMPDRAIELAREHHGVIHLLVTDVIMPEMNGLDLAKNILTLHPGIKRLFMSGYTADVIAHHGVLDDGVHFIQKPFSLLDMTAMVRKVLDGVADK